MPRSAKKAETKRTGMSLNTRNTLVVMSFTITRTSSRSAALSPA